MVEGKKVEVNQATSLNLIKLALFYLISLMNALQEELKLALMEVDELISPNLQ